ncbi:MAG: aromatic ring-hydroxylating dioxygenase subunit alpha [Sphingopyxis sp.]|nr:aromatic ring-hydroxylating dioxygenase subunit alpha [Sphingopyxis sp.]
MDGLLDDAAVAQRILDHIDHRTTDLGDACWREPVANYRSSDRLDLELMRAFRRAPTPYCPSAALTDPGSYVAREAAGVPLLAVRGADGVARVFRNACRHRGAQLACGTGRTKAFVCPYHAWTYGTDGSLRSIPHAYGFPDIDPDMHGLVAVQAEEKAGLVFVTQEPTGASCDLGPIAELLGADLRLVSTAENESAANWKIVAEAFLEGYHIYATHRTSFYPVQFDNLNVVEHFGRNSRVTFPYRNVEKLRGIAPTERHLEGTVTQVYHLFPNVMIATFPKRTLMVVLEPSGVATTRTITYTLAAASTLDHDLTAVEQDESFVNKGAREDRAIVESIQRGLNSGANDVFSFGLFEAAIVHFHRNLHALVGEAV